MVEVKRLTIDVIKAHRKLIQVIRKLKLAQYRESLKESVEFSERFNYRRFYDIHNETHIGDKYDA